MTGSPAISAGAAHVRRFWVVHRKALVVEPQILEAVAVVDAVDHYRHALQPRLPAVRHAGIEDGRPGIVFSQSLFDGPHHPLTLLEIALHRLAVDHLVDFRVAIPGVISLRTANIVLVKGRI